MNALAEEIITVEVQIRALYDLRGKQADLILEKNRRQVEFDRECADLLKDLSDTKDAMTVLEDGIKGAALIAFELSGDKAAIAGVQVKEIKQPPIYDNDKGMEWAEKDAPMFILRTFDRKGFDGYLKTAEKVPDFVTIPDPMPRAEIATDLRNIVEGM